MNKEQLVSNLVSMIYGNKIVGFDKREEFLEFTKKIIELVNELKDSDINEYRRTSI